MKTSDIDVPRISAAAHDILEAIGEDPDREGLRDTPLRVARMYAELFDGLHTDPRSVLTAIFAEEHQEMVVVRDIPFYSMCEHHLLPFHGVAHFGYLPNGSVVGLSKIARLVECLSRRPQVQERLSGQ
ncbi:MAG TPA: GTP cyclohydrolase I, partial [Chloroflexota bacterium]|nr:GTP cyclohydrolase I [Chloroflexota bacterium]